jgi:hypothetical protein
VVLGKSLYQVHAETGVYHSVYLRRMLGHLRAACKDTSPRLRILYTQLQFFNNKEDYGMERNEPSDQIVLTPVIGSNSYRLRSGQLELEWKLK